MKKYLGKKGFTLVELIVVIAIIAVLAVVGIPAIAGQVAKAKEAAAAANIRLIASACNIALAEVDMETVARQVDIYKGTPDETGKELYKKIINVVGTQFEDKFRINVMDAGAAPDTRGLFHLYFTDKGDIGEMNESDKVYRYHGGKIEKDADMWQEKSK